MSANNNTIHSKTASAAETQPPVTLEPEALVEQIRVLRSQIKEVTPLTTEQRRTLRARSRYQSDAMVASSLNVLGALDKVALAIGQQPEEVRQLQVDWNRWAAVAGELRALLNGVDGANLVRRERLALISAQAYTIGTQLARDPANAILLPHIEEVKRLKSFANRKKAAQKHNSPTPDPAPDTSTKV